MFAEKILRGGCCCCCCCCCEDSSVVDVFVVALASDMAAARENEDSSEVDVFGLSFFLFCLLDLFALLFIAARGYGQLFMDVDGGFL